MLSKVFNHYNPNMFNVMSKIITKYSDLEYGVSKNMYNMSNGLSIIHPTTQFDKVAYRDIISSP